MPNAPTIARVAILKTGCHTDNSGTKRCFSRDDLDAIAARITDPVPHVITHGGAFGPASFARSPKAWREGDLLFVDAEDPQADFAALVKDRRLYSRSVRLLYGAEGPRLAHIAWLGAEPPAVEGLPAVEFSGGGEVSDFAMSSWAEVNHAEALGSMMRRMREFLIAKFSIEEADKVMPEWDLRTLDEYAAAMRQDAIQDSAQAANMAAPEGDDVAVGDDPAVAALRAENAALQARLNEMEGAGRRAEFSRWVNDQVAAGRLTVAEVPGIIEEMEVLAQAADYSAGDAAAVSPLARYRQRIEGRGPQVPGASMSKGTDPGVADFSQQDPVTMADRAQGLIARRRAAGQRISVPEAIDLVRQGIND